MKLTARSVLRLALLAVAAVFYVAAVLEHPRPLAMAIGLVPIVWLAIEAAWHAFD